MQSNQEKWPKEAHGKIEVILQAAQHRLGLYGYEKTTMKEIADDIAMSKAALYYYFPDKENLYKSVIEKEQKEFFMQVENAINTFDNPEDMLKAYIKFRIGYFREFLNLSKFRSSEQEQVKPILRQLFDNFRVNERMLLARIFRIGKMTGRFHYNDEDKLADLFLDIIKGLRFSLITQKAYVELTQKELELLEATLDDCTDLFIRGLRYTEAK
jgi:AcrR family transcriptional regulator